MSCPCSASSSAMRSASIVAPCRIDSASTGIRPISAHPSHASNSTSSQRCSRDVSLKIFAICCGAYRGITYLHSIGVTGGSSLPLVIAHRGASREAPENTPAAFEAAIALGADAVELDVRRTADGVLVVHHNASRRGSPPLDADLPGAGPAEPPRAAAASTPSSISAQAGSRWTSRSRSRDTRPR